jgi:5-methylcytosine-specific restriction endonuclease McrA
MAKSSHRRPPRPVHWECSRGTCRFCGEAIIENAKVNTRKHWHPACAKTWRIMNRPADARDAVLKRDRYTCQDCGHADRHGRFEVDHRKPLFEAHGDPTYWQLPNLVLLCQPCHQRKTLADMVRYRASLKT